VTNKKVKKVIARLGRILFVLAALWICWYGSALYGKHVAQTRCKRAFYDALGRAHSTDVDYVPKTCVPGDLVFNTKENHYYMCVVPGRWIVPNYEPETSKLSQR